MFEHWLRTRTSSQLGRKTVADPRAAHARGAPRVGGHVGNTRRVFSSVEAHYASRARFTISTLSSSHLLRPSHIHMATADGGAYRYALSCGVLQTSS